MINNRQAGRRRGRGGQQQRSSGGNPGRQDTGNRIDNRARGNAAQLLEKYKTLARDAQMQGDRVNVEYYLQFADHYFRVLAETRARFEENGGAVSTRRIQGATLDEDEPDYEEEDRAAEQARQGGQQNGGDQQQRGQNGGQQNGQQGQYRQEGREGRQDRDGNRGYNQNGQGNGQGSANNNAQNGGQQNGAEQRGGQDLADRSRERANGDGGNANAGGYERQPEQPREDRSERQPRFERAPRQVEPRQVEPRPVEPRQVDPAPVSVALDPVEEAPRRPRGRPRREAVPVAAPAFEDAGDDTGFAADLLPPSLTISAVVAPEAANDGDAGEVVEKPRRRRGRPPASEAGNPG